MAGLNDAPFVQNLAVPAVCVLIAFLGYGSQLVFLNSTLDPGPPTRTEAVVFNVLLLLLWFTYYRAITVPAGRYVFQEQVIEVGGRWCNKCEAPKPPRSHHCRYCRRCIPRMDHHCPWTKNCVSMTTFPHFLRFLVYTNLSLWVLGYFLYQRFYTLWRDRWLPAYLGPSLAGLISLSVLSLVCFFTSFALLVMLVTTVRSWVLNQTIIETWEIERHEAVANRASGDWWDVLGPNGEPFRFEKLEFPYDIGFFANMSQAMGTSNVLLWLWPFAGNPTIDKSGTGDGWDWSENGFNRIEGLWPPPDPEKLRKAARGWPAARRDFEAELRHMTPEQTKAEFEKRQQADERRQRMLMAELEEIDDYDMVYNEEETSNFGGKTAWTSSDGSRLRDFGVDEDEDEDVEDDNDDDVPLAELIRRRKVLQKDGDE